MLLTTSMNNWAVAHRAMRAAAATAFIILGANVAVAKDDLDPEADKILHTMATYLGGLKTFTADYDVENEVVLKTGQKLQLNASGTMAIERPGKLHVTRKGPLADAEVTFDGKTVSILGHNANAYAQIESPGPTIDAAIEEVRMATGLDFAGADLLLADPYAVLTDDLEQSSDVGIGYVSGIECDHLAFRKGDVDWQIWIQQGKHPLPMKYVITSKWVTGAPQYSIQLSNWNVEPKLKPDVFSFVPPAGAAKLDELHADESGELTAGDAK
jgi:hypothetical protein